MLCYKKVAKHQKYQCQYTSFHHRLYSKVVFYIKLGDILCSFVVLCRSPNQSSDIFKPVSKNLELTLDCIIQNTAYMMVLSGDFNAKCTSWYKDRW